MKVYILFIWTLICTSLAFSQTTKVVEYKKLDSASLKMTIYFPDNYQETKKHASIVFFFGGGWSKGGIGQFTKHAAYFAKRGMVCFLPEYRTKKSHGTAPFESLKDAKSAMRFIRKNADKYKIDGSNIVAGGGSAGGHLAAATAYTELINENSDDLSISAKPQALVLYNPVIDNGPGGYGYSRVKERYKEFSPYHNIPPSNAVPTIFFLGTKDNLIPVATGEKYKRKTNEASAKCDLWLFEEQGHGFFNKRKEGHNYNYFKTVYETDRFLIGLSYLKKKPTIKVPTGTSINAFLVE